MNGPSLWEVHSIRSTYFTVALRAVHRNKKTTTAVKQAHLFKDLRVVGPYPGPASLGLYTKSVNNYSKAKNISRWESFLKTRQFYPKIKLGWTNVFLPKRIKSQKMNSTNSLNVNNFSVLLRTFLNFSGFINKKNLTMINNKICLYQDISSCHEPYTCV